MVDVGRLSEVQPRGNHDEMRRLTGLDASFLYLETPNNHMHVSGTYIFDPSDVDGGYSFERVKAMIANRLHRLKPFRWRLVEVPFGLHHPIWIEDPEFDIDNHVFRRHVAAPGGRAELLAMAGEIMGERLKRERPLWEAHLIEGLEDGRVAMVAKTHHAAIDGASGAELITNLLDLTAEITVYDDVPWQPEPIPSETEMLTYALNSLARQPAALAVAVKDVFQSALQRRLHPGAGPVGESSGGMFKGPRTPLNVPITASRSFATTEISLGDIKLIRQAFGGTVNDVVLALCAGALRRYLERMDELPDEPLIAMVPISVRSDDQRGAMGNRVSNMFVALATDVADPVERLQKISEHTKVSKERASAIGGDTLSDWAEFAPPAIAAMASRAYSSMRLASHHAPAFNVTISNVPGPQFPLYSAGARLEAWYPMGPIFDGGGLNMTVMSYDGALYFGLVACPDVVPSVDDIAGFIDRAAKELLNAAKGHDLTTTTARVKKVAKKSAPAPTSAKVAKKPGKSSKIVS